MSQVQDSDILKLVVSSLNDAIRRLAARTLETPGALDVTHYRDVERLMRIAIALAGAGNRTPFVEYHGIPATAEPESLPEIVSVDLVDLLAARAADHLLGALRGDPEPLRALEQEAERILETEDIQLI
jgi:hypothetical protein